MTALSSDESLYFLVNTVILNRYHNNKRSGKQAIPYIGIIEKISIDIKYRFDNQDGRGGRLLCLNM